MTDAAAGPVSDDEIREAIRRYFSTAAERSDGRRHARRVTDDFRTGMPSGGYQWDGPRGREDFLCDRKGFVDEQHDIDEVLSREDVGEVVWLKTLLTFHLRDPNTEGLSPASRTRQAHHRCFVELGIE
jgi:5-methylcytosine-specific restriction endonuclease McrA